MSLVLARPVMEGQTMMNKSSLPTIERVAKEWLKGKKDESENNSQVSQIWLKDGTKSPKAIIPIQPNTVADSMKKQHHYSSRKPQVPGIIEQALAVYSAPGEILGAGAQINVWNPVVEEQDEFSLAQISIKNGENQETNIIEAGWHVLPSLYGDTKTRLYIYWTGGMGTGCYNNFCDGFEQIAEDVTLGGQLHLSAYDGDQVDITIVIQRGTGAHWHLMINGRRIGYWLRLYFNHLRLSGSRVEWGGKVSNTRPQNRHTTTSMGSGHLADEGFRKASYFHNLQIEDLTDGESLKPVPSLNLTTLTTNTNCYNIVFPILNSPSRGFYYGGPGFNPNCP
ncbi:uncharacterized protein LOC120005937 [Tripterygium wilfordii]|uniref:uncharacterized protein LOC120005937 n=1 Tax=Tripterygium wilfordii TaxID=458696 RepID=UPI0018F7F6BF|nr:uncharacterized protein LOC120005937 [Tripterygium wilfordii]